MSEYHHVFQPIRIGSIEVRNRLFVSAHHTEMTEPDPEGYNRWTVLGRRAADYHADRAKGGFGLIMVGQTQVHPQSGSDRPAAHNDASIVGHRRIAERCHQHGAIVFVQLAQNGPERQSSGPDAWEPVWGPSATASAVASSRGEMAKQMEADDIASMVAGFARSARNCEEAGMDGVEIHAAHPHMLGHWLVPALNKRTDDYGGSIEKRLRIVLEVVDAVRNAVSPSFVVGVRINGEWSMPGGQTVDEAVVIATMLEATGQIDFLNVSAWPGIDNIGTPFGRLIPWAATVKEAVTSVPVFGIGRIVRPEHAEEILAAGRVDMVGMTRASIADPELPNKARDGRSASIRVCVGAGQGCLARNRERKPMTCQQNPAVGREREWGIDTLRPAAQARRVTVVGGGPAGMEAAIVAARRGHEVVLFERSDRLGGQLRLIADAVPRRAELDQIAVVREHELAELGVDIRRGVTATSTDVLAEHPDHVVIATGSIPRRVGWYPAMPHLEAIPGSDLGHVVAFDRALLGGVDDATHVVVIDGTGYYQTADVLEYLAQRSNRVTAVSHHVEVAAGIDAFDRPNFLRSVLQGDVALIGSVVVETIESDAVHLRDLVTGVTSTIEHVDGVVVAIGSDVADGLYRELVDRLPSVQRIGDCVAPRGIEHALFDGHRTGRSL